MEEEMVEDKIVRKKKKMKKAEDDTDEVKLRRRAATPTRARTLARYVSLSCLPSAVTTPHPWQRAKLTPSSVHVRVVSGAFRLRGTSGASP